MEHSKEMSPSPVVFILSEASAPSCLTTERRSEFRISSGNPIRSILASSDGSAFKVVSLLRVPEIWKNELLSGSDTIAPPSLISRMSLSWA